MLKNINFKIDSPELFSIVGPVGSGKTSLLMTILGEIEHEFSPQGCTFMFLLSESHLSVHTFPERQHLAFDLYTCRQYEDNTIYINIFLELCKKLGTSAQQCTYNILDRTFFQPLRKVEPNRDILEFDLLGFHL